MSTVIQSESGKLLTLDQGTLFEMAAEVDVTEPKKSKPDASFAQENFLVEDLRRRIAQLEDELGRARKERQKAWDRATDAMEAEQFLRRLAEFMTRYQSDPNA